MDISIKKKEEIEIEMETVTYGDQSKGVSLTSNVVKKRKCDVNYNDSNDSSNGNNDSNDDNSVDNNDNKIQYSKKRKIEDNNIISSTSKKQDYNIGTTNTTTTTTKNENKENENENDVDTTIENDIGQDNYNPILYGCRSVDNYEKLNKIDEGTYGVVFRARNRKSNEIVALKQVKLNQEQMKDGFPITALRETNILLSLKHPNIVSVKEMVFGENLNKVFMVMEFCENDLKKVMEKHKRDFSRGEVKSFMSQLLHGVKHMHNSWYLHRDLKTSNLLYSNDGKLAICDFGLARKYGDPIKNYTPKVVTPYYRSPELYLGALTYSTAVDMWSIGCIFAELITRTPLFPGKDERDTLEKIFQVIGAPTKERWTDYGNPSILPSSTKWNFKVQKENRLRYVLFEMSKKKNMTYHPSISEEGIDLMHQLLEMDPKKRISAEDALQHEWFSEDPPPTAREQMPTFQAKHEEDIL